MEITANDRPTWGDVIAGISVSFILIPQALAYAELAGAPPYVGLFAAALPPIVAAFFASSRYLQTGPVAMTALLTYGALGSLGATPFSPEWVKLASLMAVLVGVVRLVLGLLRGGVIAYLLSQPVLVGFTSAAALLILASQLPTALGAQPGPGGIITRAVSALTMPGSWDRQALVLAACTAAFLTFARRLHPLFPAILVAVTGATIAGTLGFGGAMVGAIPTGLPPFSLDLPWSSIPRIAVPAIVVAVVGFAEPASIARTFAAADRTRWDSSRELVSQGLANLASGFSGSFPVGGSFARTSVSKMAGARTRWSGAVTGVAVLAFLPFASLLERLPKAFLAATVIAAVSRLVRPDHILGIWNASRPQGLVAGISFAATLVYSPRIDKGVVAGIAAAVAVHLVREMRIRVESSYSDGVLTLRPRGVLFFASTPSLEERLMEALGSHAGLQRLEIDLHRLGRIDYTGAVALLAVRDDARAAGLSVGLEGVPPQSQAVFDAVFETASETTRHRGERRRRR